MQDIVCIIPACNEAATIFDVASQCGRYGDVVVVDDCSEDATAELAKQAGAVVLRLPFRMGAWNATQAGMHFAKRFSYRYVVTLDADEQHNPDDIPSLLNAAERQSNHSVIIGNDVSRGSVGRKMAWTFFRWLTALPCADLTSGYRVYDQSALDIVLCRKATLCEYQDVGILMLLKKNGVAFQEVAITMRPRKNGGSRVFSSWGKVATYLMKTVVVSLVSHLDVAETRLDDWRVYDEH